MKILFMGTPEIAANVLRRLLADGHNIAAVVTGEDKVRGRGKTLTPTPTKALAIERGIPVYTPKTLRDGEFLSLLSEISPELIVVVAYGKILPPAVLELPKFGCINLHVSLLPKYRGAAPMQRAVMNGDSVTGVTVMYMAEGLDTGDIIAQRSFPISESDDFEAVHDRSSEIGAALLSETIPKIEDGTAERTPQNESEATYAEKIQNSDCKVDFSRAASVVSARIRGVTPIPYAYCYHRGKMLKLLSPTVVEGEGKPGQIIALDGKGEGGITVACGSGAVKILRVIPEGKGKMTAGDYIRGRKIELGDIFE